MMEEKPIKPRHKQHPQKQLKTVKTKQEAGEAAGARPARLGLPIEHNTTFHLMLCAQPVRWEMSLSL